MLIFAYLIQVVGICVSRIVNEFEPLYLGLLTLRVSSSVSYLISFFACLFD